MRVLYAHGVDLAVRLSRRHLAPLATLVALAVVLVPASAGADVAARSLAEPAAEVHEYWTPERMRSARPASELLAGVPVVNDLVDGLLGGGEPAQRSAAKQVANPSKRPRRTHGKVYFTLPSGDYVCSGTVVRSKTKRLVVTAGHCVFGDNAFASKWLFVPGKNGAGTDSSAEPFGRWTAARLATTSQWQSREDIRYDVGMATMQKLKGKRLQRVVGARGIAFGQGRNLNFNAFGYPARGRFSGNHLYRCSSPAQGTDSGSRPRPTRIDCDMTGGASGGGWIISKGRVNSVTSYGYESLCPLPPIICSPNPERGKLFGPYFGKKIRDLYRSERR